MFRMLIPFRNLVLRGRISCPNSPRIQTYSTKKDKSEEVFKTKIKQKEKETLQNLPEWTKRDETIRKRYGEWKPTHKLSRQQIQDIRNIKDKMPHMKTIELSNHFKISPEAIRRILKSSWVPSDADEEQIRLRGEKRKDESQTTKKEMMNDIELARKRLTYGKSINLGGLYVPKSRGSKLKNLRNTFSTDGKVKFDSNNSHGYYNRKGKPKAYKRKPYVENVGDIID